MEDMRLVETSGTRRRAFLTAAGKAQLLREQDRWSLLVNAIGRIMSPASAGSGENE